VKVVSTFFGTDKVSEILWQVCYLKKYNIGCEVFYKESQFVIIVKNSLDIPLYYSDRHDKNLLGFVVIYL